MKIPQTCHQHSCLPRRPGCYLSAEEKIYGTAHLHPSYYYIQNGKWSRPALPSEIISILLQLRNTCYHHCQVTRYELPWGAHTYIKTKLKGEELCSTLPTQPQAGSGPMQLSGMENEQELISSSPGGCYRMLLTALLGQQGSFVQSQVQALLSTTVCFGDHLMGIQHWWRRWQAQP